MFLCTFLVVSLQRCLGWRRRLASSLRHFYLWFYGFRCLRLLAHVPELVVNSMKHKDSFAFSILVISCLDFALEQFAGEREMANSEGKPLFTWCVLGDGDEGVLEKGGDR